LHLTIGLSLAFIGLIPFGWACGLYGPRWFARRFGFVRVIVGCGSGFVIFVGLLLSFG
jgi:hypothetical protein